MFLPSSHCGVSCEVADWMCVLDTGFFMALYVLEWSNQIILGIPSSLSIAGNEASSRPCCSEFGELLALSESRMKVSLKWI